LFGVKRSMRGPLGPEVEGLKVGDQGLHYRFDLVDVINAIGAVDIAERVNGSKFFKLKSGYPVWMTEVIQAGHDAVEEMPNDKCYETIVHFIDAATGYDDIQGALDELEPDVYTCDQLAWLTVGRTHWLDNAAGELDAKGSAAIGLAQLLWKTAVCSAVFLKLQAVTGEDE